MQLSQMAPKRHLLEPIILLAKGSYPGPHVGIILRVQGMHQTHRLPSRGDEGTFVLILGNLLILAPVVGFVLQVMLSQQVGAHN
jgi:hypothetical protein